MLQRLLAVLASVFVIAPSAFAQYARVSLSSAGVQANGASDSPSLSDDGRYVAFSSAATNFVTGDTNGVNDCYLHDRDTDADGTFDEAAARATTRISITSTGTEFAGACLSPVVSGDGRYAAFLTAATLPPSLGTFVGNGNGAKQVLRWDRTTGAIDVVTMTTLSGLGNGDSDQVDMSNDGRLVIFRSKSTNFVSGEQGEIANIFLRDMQTGSLVRLSTPQPAIVQAGFLAANHYESPSLSGDGRVAAFTRVQTTTVPDGGMDQGFLFIADIQAGTPAVQVANEIRARLSDDGADLLVLGLRYFEGVDIARHHRATGDRFPRSTIFNRLFLLVRNEQLATLALGQDARYAIALMPDSPASSRLWDLAYERSFPLPFTGRGASLDASGRYAAIETPDALATAPDTDTNTAADIYVVDLPRALDADGDTLDDRWETTFGLSTSSGTGADGPTGDPDNDGITNAAELAAGTHPRGLHTRYLAEGASGGFFSTVLALANPNTPSTPGASTVVTFLRPNEAPVRTFVQIQNQTRRTILPATIAGLESADFSMVIESDLPIVADRTMSWDATGYGAHTETAAPAAATTWYLAEGSTVIDFNLFYLLQNPQPTTVAATIRYLRPSGAPIVKTMQLPPNSRTTIYVNEADPALAETDVSGVIEASAPIVVERAMYANRPNQPFALGHDAKGVTAPATSWFLAEGATGAFFDTYVLIANPSTSDAAVEVRFLKPDGSVVTRSHTVPQQSRFSIFVDGVPGLESTAVSTTVTSTNAVRIIVERAMYWPNGFFDYYEGHSSAGTTTTATKWALAEGEAKGPREAQTFVLIANTSNQPGQARVTILPDLGSFFNSTASPRVIDLPPNSRTTVEIVPTSTTSTVSLSRFGMLVESIGDTPVPIVVEGAFYWSPGGIIWAAGSNVVATPIP